MRKLTTKQRKFCDNYIKSGNATQSAIKAGYSKRSARQTGNRILSKDYIRHYVHSKLNQISNSTIASAKEILKYYTNVLRGNITEDVIIGTPDAEIKDKKRPDIHDRTEAAKELMKRYAPLYKAKVKKLTNEASIKGFKAEHANTKNNNVNSKVDELLDAIFKDKKHSANEN